MLGIAMLVLALQTGPVPVVETVAADKVGPSSLDRLEFLTGDWEATFEMFPESYGPNAGTSPGTVRGWWGPQRGWFEMESQTSIPGSGAYTVKVLLYANRDAGYGAYVVTTFGNGASYVGRFVGDTILSFTGTMGAKRQRVTYEQHGPDRIRFFVEESIDGGTTFVRHSEAWWRRVERNAQPVVTESPAKGASMSRVNHFELPADDPERALGFYRDVFGWSFTKWDGPMEYWVIETGSEEQPGINGGLMRRDQPGSPPVNVIYVKSIDDIQAKIRAAGGQVIVPRMAIPGVGWQAYFVDPEQNMLGLLQVDPAAR